VRNAIEFPLRDPLHPFISGDDVRKLETRSVAEASTRSVCGGHRVAGVRHRAPRRNPPIPTTARIPREGRIRWNPDSRGRRHRRVPPFLAVGGDAIDAAHTSEMSTSAVGQGRRCCSAVRCRIRHADADLGRAQYRWCHSRGTSPTARQAAFAREQHPTFPRLQPRGLHSGGGRKRGLPSVGHNHGFVSKRTLRGFNVAERELWLRWA
jgi:hypothetical protein